MRLTLVGAYPPSSLSLGEHTAYMVRALKAIDKLKLTVIADEIPNVVECEDISGMTLNRCWKHNHFPSIFRIFREVRNSKPEVIWFNLVLSSFSDTPVKAFLSLMLPMILRLFTKARVVVTLHAPVESVDLSKTKHRKFAKIKTAVGTLAQKFLFKVDVVYVYLDEYVRLLQTSYGIDHVFRSRHGIEDGEESSLSKCEDKSVLIFGRFGGYKDLGMAMDVIARLERLDPSIRFTIAGSDHPSYPGYYQSIQSTYRHLKNTTFRGYIPEEDMETLFRSHAVVWLPYNSNTGVSGVAHRACRFGNALLIPNLPDFIAMLEEEGMAAAVYEARDSDSAIRSMFHVLENKEFRLKIAELNVQAALRYPTNKVISEHVSFIREKFDIAA